MGTRLVYDYQQQKWIPYVSDPDKWYQHLLDVRDGYAENDVKDRAEKKGSTRGRG